MNKESERRNRAHVNEAINILCSTVEKTINADMQKHFGPKFRQEVKSRSKFYVEFNNDGMAHWDCGLLMSAIKKNWLSLFEKKYPRKLKSLAYTITDIRNDAYHRGFDSSNEATLNNLYQIRQFISCFAKHGVRISDDDENYLSNAEKIINGELSGSTTKVKTTSKPISASKPKKPAAKKIKPNRVLPSKTKVARNEIKNRHKPQKQNIEETQKGEDDEKYWKRAISTPQLPFGFKQYIDNHPNGTHILDAKSRLQSLNSHDEKLWEDCAAEDTVVSFRKYLNKAFSTDRDKRDRAHLQIAQKYEHGLGVAKNIDAALNAYRRIKKSQYGRHQYALLERTRHYSAAERILKELCEEGYERAIFTLAQMIHGKKGYKKAKPLYEKAARAKIKEAKKVLESEGKFQSKYVKTALKERQKRLFEEYVQQIIVILGLVVVGYFVIKLWIWFNLR